MANIQQGGAEKTALVLFSVLIIAALLSLFLAVPIWVKSTNLIVAAGAFYMMYQTNKSSTFSETAMIAVWIASAILMSVLTFTHV